ncbi:hypothetical protein [Salinicoccus halitifaciens]|uniref:Uncharacterized protein n=1 Tax=Salinicoccus halitifaciens TaxID=1073415 RepID=A0ABV2E6F7_9STAP|nr:hypothetical protein [Salinicoccus halitifaciens]MCD2137295.1 hypothetical protein [Salinicoccus halitifaciens]
MPDKKRNEDIEYIIDRIRKREKERAENKAAKMKSPGQKPKESVSSSQQVHKSSTEKEEIPDMELGCYFFLILPFVASILFLIILIALLR